jgi:hypothetical protein
MPLTLGTCNGRADAAAREYALRYPNADMFRPLEQRLRETESVTPRAHVNAGRPRTVRTPTSEDAMFAAMEREPWRSSRDIGRGSSKYIMMISSIHITARGAHILCGCNFANVYDINTLRMSSFYITSVDRQSMFYA